MLNTNLVPLKALPIPEDDIIIMMALRNDMYFQFYKELYDLGVEVFLRQEDANSMIEHYKNYATGEY